MEHPTSRTMLRSALSALGEVQRASGVVDSIDGALFGNNEVAGDSLQQTAPRCVDDALDRIIEGLSALNSRLANIDCRIREQEPEKWDNPRAGLQVGTSFPGINHNKF